MPNFKQEEKPAVLANTQWVANQLSISYYSSNGLSNNRIPISCDSCKTSDADIFQDEGNYCLECWQKQTLPFDVNELCTIK